VPNLIAAGKHCNCWAAAWSCNDSVATKAITMKMKTRGIEDDVLLDWGSRMPTVCRVPGYSKRYRWDIRRAVSGSTSSMSESIRSAGAESLQNRWPRPVQARPSHLGKYKGLELKVRESERLTQYSSNRFLRCSYSLPSSHNNTMYRRRPRNRCIGYRCRARC